MIRLSQVLSELRLEHGIADHESVPYSIVSQRLTEMLRAQGRTAPSRPDTREADAPRG